MIQNVEHLHLKDLVGIGWIERTEIYRRATKLHYHPEGITIKVLLEEPLTNCCYLSSAVQLHHS
jgi:hypothetical protein